MTKINKYISRPDRKTGELVKTLSNQPLKDTKYKGKPISMYDLDKVLDDIPDFIGVIDVNEFQKLKFNNNKRTGIILLYNSHYRSIIIDPIYTLSVMYYDPYGEEPPKPILRQLTKKISDMNTNTKLKLKINKIKNQRLNSNNCGLHATRFIINILVKNYSFIKATGYTIKKAEELARKMGGYLEKFNYI